MSRSIQTNEDERRIDEPEDRLVAWSGVTDQALETGALYVVGLPIGNAADLTIRAWWTLRQVDAIAAEDTRTTRPLLQRFGIDTPLIAAHRHNEKSAAQTIVSRLRKSERIALVSDAGTPGVSDPGSQIARSVLDAGLRVIPVPGASSVTAAISAAGLAQPGFTFIGFVPAGAQQRERLLREAAASGTALVMLEAPHRIRVLAQLLGQILVAERRVVFARELTKKFETIVQCHADELEHFELDERGEYVVIVDSADRASIEPAVAFDAVTRRWLQALLRELPPSRAAAIAAQATGLPKAELYALARQLKTGPDTEVN